MDFDRDEYLVRQAGRLASQLKLPVHLVHSLEPFKFVHWTAAPFYSTDTAEGSVPSGNIFQTALAELNELCEIMITAAPVCEVTTHVLSGPPAEALVAEADAVDALMILVGSADETRFLGGFSTTRVLLSSSKIPVLVINDDCITDFSGDSLNILIADSLHEDALRPLATAAELTSKSERGLMIHAHVQDDRPGFFDRLLASSFAHMLPLNIQTIPATKSMTNLLARVKSRAKYARTGWQASPDAYLPVVVAGDPQEKLLDLADKYSADIIVFGRHRMLHLDNMTLGRVTTEGMLAHRSAVMVVPA